MNNELDAAVALAKREAQYVGGLPDALRLVLAELERRGGEVDQLRSGFQSWVNPLLSAGVGIAPGHCIVNFRAENAEKERDVARADLAKAQAGAAAMREALVGLEYRHEPGTFCDHAAAPCHRCDAAREAIALLEPKP